MRESLKVSKKLGIDFIKTTYDISLDSLISLFSRGFSPLWPSLHEIPWFVWCHSLQRKKKRKPMHHKILQEKTIQHRFLLDNELTWDSTQWSVQHFLKREGSMHLVPAPAVRLMKSRVTSRPGNKVYNLEFFFFHFFVFHVFLMMRRKQWMEQCLKETIDGWIPGFPHLGIEH